MNRDDAPNRKEGKESASDKLRRILASKEGSKQEIDDVSSSSVNEKLSKAAQTIKKENRNKRSSAVEEPHEGEEIDGLPDSPPGRKASSQNMGFSNNIKSTLKRIFFQIKEIFRRGDGDEPPKRLLRGNLYNFFKIHDSTIKIGCIILEYLSIAPLNKAFFDFLNGTIIYT